jgi:hypothetical protein
MPSVRRGAVGEGVETARRAAAQARTLGFDAVVSEGARVERRGFARAGRGALPLTLLVAALLAAAGCGYQVGGKGELLPKTLHTIAIPAFKNKTRRATS